jgi:hypothetical protein
LRHKANPELPLLMLKQGTLLCSSDEPALLAAAAYLSQPAPASGASVPGVHLDLNQIALKKGLIDPIQLNWLTQQQSLNALMQQQAITRGRAADLADPSSALASLSSMLTQSLDVVASLNAVKADLQPKADGIELQAEFDATSGGAAQAAIDRFTPGTVEPLSGLPVGVRLAVLSNNEEADPRALGDRVAAGLSGLFAQRMPAQQAQLIGSYFQDLAVALSGPCVVGWLPAVPDSGGFLLAHLADGKAFARAIEGIVRLVEIPAVKQVLANWVGAVTVRPVSGGFELSFRSSSGVAPNQKPGAEAKRISVLWRTQGDRVYLALGSSAAIILAQ